MIPSCPPHLAQLQEDAPAYAAVVKHVRPRRNAHEAVEARNVPDQMWARASYVDVGVYRIWQLLTCCIIRVMVQAIGVQAIGAQAMRQSMACIAGSG